jgi:hypothetical protein
MAPSCGRDAGLRPANCTPTDGGACDQLQLIGCAANGLGLALEGDWLLSTDWQYGVVLHSLSGTAANRTLGAQMNPAIALRDGYATWMDSALHVSRAPVDGGPTVTLTTATESTWAMAVNSTHVYWVPLKYPKDTILRADLHTGAVDVVVSGEPEVTSIAVDDSAVYWTSLLSGNVCKHPLIGGTTTVLFTGQYSPFGLQLLGGYLYWGANWIPGSVHRGSVAGGAPELIVDGLQTTGLFVTDGTTLYVWSQPYLFKVPVAGGQPQALLSEWLPGALAISPSTLYFTNDGIWALPR